MRVIRASTNTIVIDRTNTVLNTIMASIGSEASVLYIYEAVTLNNNLTIPSTCTVILEGQGTINQGSYTLTFYGVFEAPITSVFLGTGQITFRPGSVPCVYPQWFGAIGDNDATRATANLNAFRRALNSIYETEIEGTTPYIVGGILKVPPGSYYINDALEIDQYGIIIDGYGAALRYTKTTGMCIDTSDGHDITINGLGIVLHTDSASVTGIRVYSYRVNLKDVTVISNTANHTLSNGIVINGASGLVGIQNRFENIYVDCGTSIDIIYSPVVGPLASPNYFSKVIDKSYNGIYLRGCNGVKFEDLYSDVRGTHSVHFLKNGSTPATGNDIGFSRVTRAMEIESGCTYNRVFKSDTGTGGITLPLTADNYMEALESNYPTISAKIATFSSGDTTPSVRGNKVVKTANAAPTTITMLDDGVEGQTVRVIFTDTNTTIDFTGTNMKGNAGVDWAPNNGDCMICVFDGTNWYCNVVDCTA